MEKGLVNLSDLLIKMALAAIEDETLFAHNIQQYALQQSLSWDEVADKLQIGREQLAKLALCSRPQTGLHNGEVIQVAKYVGVDHTLLKAFGIGVESSDTLPTKRVSEKKKLKNAIQRRESGRRWNIMAMLPKHRGWAFGVVILLIFLLGAFVFNRAESASGATLVVNEGQATILEGNARDISQGVVVPADGAFAVRAGDQILLSADSTAQLRLIDGSTIDLTAGTNVNVDELVIDDTTYRVHLRLLAGRTLSRVVTVLGLGDRFEISTPSSSASVRGTIFTVAYISADETFISCDEGKVEVALEGQESQIVSAGMEVTAVVGQPLQVRPQQATEVQQPPAPITIPESSPSDEQVEAPQNLPEYNVVELASVEFGPFENGRPERVPGSTPVEESGTGETSSGEDDSATYEDGTGNTGDDGTGDSGDDGDGDGGNNGPPEAVPGNPPEDPPGVGTPPEGGGTPPGQDNNNSDNNNAGGNSSNSGSSGRGGKK